MAKERITVSGGSSKKIDSKFAKMSRSAANGMAQKHNATLAKRLNSKKK